MYKDILIGQWDNLCSDCEAEYDLCESHGEITASLNRWYEARIHRWSSISYPEGIILEQQNDSAMAQKLKGALKNFRFHDVDPTPQKPGWISILIGILAGAVSSGILYLLHWNTLKIVISGIVVAAVVMGLIIKQLEQDKKKEKARLKNEYMNQLRKYQKVLTDICGNKS